MALSATLQSLDGIDDAIQSLYAEKDGVYILQVEGIDTHPEVANLKSAYERTKQDRDAIRAEREQIKGDLAKTIKGKPDEQALVQERQAYETRIADLEGKLAETEGKLTATTRDSAFKAALADAGITDPFYVDLLTAKHGADVKMSDGKALVETGMGPKDVSQWAKEQAASTWGKLVTPSSGGGAKGAENGGQKPLNEMGDAERLELARAGKL